MSTVVLASAGTGKTHTLVDAWLKALLGLDDGEAKPAETLLAITFTEKAAAEMRARIERRLARLRFTPGEEAALVDEFAARGLAVPTSDVLDAARRSIARAPIGTFHAMCGRVLREHALAAGLDPGFRLLEPDEEQRLLAELAEAVIVDALVQETAHKGEGAVGGAARFAGGGLVRELVARIPLRGLYEQRGLTEALVALHASLAERGLSPSSLAAATPASSFSEATQRLEQALLDVEKSGAKNTAARVQQTRLRLQALQLVRAGNVDDDADAEAAVARVVGEMRDGVSGAWGGAPLTELRRALVDAVEGVGAALVDEFIAPSAPGVLELLKELDRRQRREKEQRAVLGFGDLLERTRDLLVNDRSVRARVKGRFRRVFVDEYQDTSPVQEQIVALLVDDPMRGGPFDPLVSPFSQVKVPTNRAFLVGDPKQSIYGFRGADADVFARALRDLDNKTVVPLTVSRRSTSSVCAYVNLVTSAILPEHAAESLAPLVDAPLAPVGAWWRPGPSFKARALPAVEQDGLIVADQLTQLFNAARAANPEAPALRPRDVVVLVRRGRAAAVLGRSLNQKGVPVRVVGGDGFWRRPEVQDVVSALALVIDPGDELAALAVLRSPLVAVPDDQVLALFEAGPFDSRGPQPGLGNRFSWRAIVDAADDDLVDRGVADRVRRFDALLLSIRTHLATEPLTRAIDLILDEGGYATAAAVEPDAALRLRHLEKLRGLCAGRPEEGVLAIARLVDALDDPPPEPVLFAPPDDGAADDGAVSVMTIHQAKGLEAEVVVVADAGIALRTDTDDVLFDASVGLAISSRGRPVHRLSPKSPTASKTAIQRVRKARRDRDERELRRLLYVALTRARRGIYVSGTPKRKGPGSLLGLLDEARANSGAAHDALVAEFVVDSVSSDAFVSSSAKLKKRPAPSDSDASPIVEVTHRPRLRASSLYARATPQLGLGFGFGPSPQAEPDGHDDDVLPPRARGRLAHAVIALVAGERPEATVDPLRCRQAVRDALDATGAPQSGGVTAVDDALVDRIVATLCGPVRGLIDDDRLLIFEEPLVLATDVVVVEGTADLIAHGADNSVVIEFKLSKAAAQAASSTAQVQACCAALSQRSDQPLKYAVWSIGDAAPPRPTPFGPPARRELAALLARITVPA